MARKKINFPTRISPEPNSGCWLWTGPYDRHGYGKTEHTTAHRVAWKLYRGEIVGGLHVLHRCDNRVCVNPSHLFLGTNLDNVRDRQAKGRGLNLEGEKNGRAKLSIAAVAHIRRREMTSARYAEKYGVAKSTISMVITGSNWKIP